MIRTENGKKILYSSYLVSKDTLKLIEGNKQELHLVTLKKNNLIFNPVYPFEKDIQLIDETIFIKKD